MQRKQVLADTTGLKPHVGAWAPPIVWRFRHIIDTHRFKSPPTLESPAFEEIGRRKGRLMNGSYESALRAMQEFAFCPEEPRLEVPIRNSEHGACFWHR